MKRMFRSSVIAASLLSLTIVTACGDSSESSAPASNQAGGESGKPLEISWLSFNPPEDDQSPVQQALEKKFNVKFKNIRVERANYEEQTNIKFSSGEIADVIFLDFSPKRIETLANQGVIAELPEEEVRQNLPEYIKTVDETDKSIWSYSQVNGKNYAVPILWPLGSMPFLPGYNGNWLKKIGYSSPPETLEQFEDVLRKFRNDDPDGNGKKDTFGLSGQGLDPRSFSAVFGAYHIRPDYMVDPKTGKVVYGLTTETAREVLKLLNRWYGEGLIDPEFVTKTQINYHDDFVNGIVGVRDWMSYQFEPRVGIIGSPFYTKNPGNEIVIGKPLKGPDGSGSAYSYSKRNSVVVLGKQVEKDPVKKAKIYEILNALATDDQTYLTSVYGIEGEHYELKDGVPIMKPEYASENNRYTIGAGLFYGLFGNKSKLMENYDFTKETQAFIAKLRDGVTTMESLSLYVPAQTKYPDLDKLTGESYLKFIRGESNLEEDFDQFVQVWNESGGKEILDEINAKYSFDKK